MPDWLNRANEAARAAGAASREKSAAKAAVRREKRDADIEKMRATAEQRNAALKERRIALEQKLQRRQGPTTPENAPTVQVVTYKTPREYERDAQKRLVQGWTIAAQTQETGQTHRIKRATNGAVIGGLFMMPGLGAAIGGLSNKRSPGPITVTWIRQPAPTPSSPSAL